MKRRESFLQWVRVFSNQQSLFFMFALCCTLALTVGVQASADGKKHKEKTSEEVEVKNFGSVNDHLFRGGQPEEEEYEQLAANGIKTIIDLRDDAKSKARKLAERAGMKYINLRLDDKVPPTMQESNLFLSLVNDRTNWPIFVHCAGGRHRTGVLIAVYRMEIDGWNAGQAYEEMKDFKFYSRFGHGDMKDYVFDYYRKMTEARLQNAAAPASRARQNAEAERK
ncbi:MAG TPA: dual specificity protein phosphatase family protein [Blastocatellia bacterium]|nr:dual specificity protein phosphatase family protein [Blastocatellia bacterium]HMV85022.1 dual specificity protein phosphatase family protein [Blastocatellia bacterium]HMZ20852.1 dual specificity protein phosphatase family protein [Blastocatellia bacterium]HNG30900.1 dual specificity protein phosphatase family protein [Blastocatellia bacterium]